MSRQADLTPEQQAVVCHAAGHARVLAGPGSGKTEVLCRRVLHLRSLGEGPIGVLMFGRAARDAFARRLGCSAVEAATFHALAYRVVGDMRRRAGMPPIEVDEHGVLVRDHLRDVRRQLEAHPANAALRSVPEDWLESFLALARAHGAPPGGMAERMGYPRELAATLQRLFVHLQERCASTGVATYDDLLLWLVAALEQEPDTVEASLPRYAHLLIDEYQDASPVQARLVEALADRGTQIMVVGDPDQAIMSFRGATPEVLTRRFLDRLGGTTYRLARTFRYGHAVACAASSLIARNRDREPMTVVPNNDAPPSIVRWLPGRAADLVEDLAQRKGWGRWSDIAILVRYHASTAAVVAELKHAGIPYRRIGRTTLQAVHLRVATAVQAILDLGQHPDKQTALVVQALAGMVPALSVADKHTLVQALDDTPVSRWPSEVPRCVAGPHDLARQTALAGSLRVLAGRIEGRVDVSAVLRHWLGGIPLRDHDARILVQAALRLVETRGVQAACNLAVQWLATGVQAGQDAVAVLTIHAAKGMEWDTVYLADWEAGVFPRPDTDVEEERRLAYVALTRARREAVVCTPPDPALARAVEVGDTRAPPFSAASPFAFELGLGVASEIARVAASGGVEAVQARDPEPFRSYLRAAGLAGRVHLTQVVDLAHERSRVVEPAVGQVWAHPAHGPATIEAVADGRVVRMRVHATRRVIPVRLLQDTLWVLASGLQEPS